MTELEKLRAENRLLKAQNKRQEMEMAFLKKLGEKWLTDVTEMKYGVSCDWPFQCNALVFETFDIAHKQHPEAKPIFHSDRGDQYTSKVFKKKLDNAGMTQSMSRVSRCIDNGPMEAFWGIENRNVLLKDICLL